MDRRWRRVLGVLLLVSAVIALYDGFRDGSIPLDLWAGALGQIAMAVFLLSDRVRKRLSRPIARRGSSVLERVGMAAALLLIAVVAPLSTGFVAVLVALAVAILVFDRRLMAWGSGEEER